MTRTVAEIEYFKLVKALRKNTSLLSQELGASWRLLSTTIFSLDISILEPIGELRLAVIPRPLRAILWALRGSKLYVNRENAWDRLVNRVVRLRKHALGVCLGRKVANMKNKR